MQHTILCVDDCPEALHTLKELLDGAGFNTLTCERSHVSLEILASTDIDCVITDLKMPILDGESFIRHIKSHHPWLPVIVLSAHIPSEKILLDYGATYALAKPIDPAKVINAVTNAIALQTGEIIFKFTSFDIAHIRDTVYARTIDLALKKTAGNQAQASKLLGVSRQSLFRFIKKYGILA